MVAELLAARQRATEGETAEFRCPHCWQPLRKIPYERTKIYECPSCEGALVENTKIPRIIVRREKKCTERIAAIARAVLSDNQRRLTTKRLKNIAGKAVPLILCPGCKSPMMRTFYSLAYLVEIDRCTYCNLTWFDKDELEMLQCIIENKMMPDWEAEKPGEIEK
jgi:Zn-finger nucleic acid-binding protein